MDIFLVCLAILALWFVFGCIVLTMADDEQQRLFEWATRAPYGLYFVVVLAWPIVLYYWYSDDEDF